MLGRTIYKWGWHVADKYFLDYEGADTAKSRFSHRAVDLAGGAGEVMPSFEFRDLGLLFNTAIVAADTLQRAFSGRMFAYSDEFTVMSEHVGGAVQVTNDVEVDLTLAP